MKLSSYNNVVMKKRRSYQKKERALAEQANGEAILDAALKAFSTELFDRVTLNAIAKESKVSVQTVIRRFGSKEDLFEHLAEREEKRVVADRDIPGEKGLKAALDTLIKHYERDGDMMTNFVSQEHLFEPIQKIVRRGREVHRHWVEKHCSNLFMELDNTKREQAILAAIAATDLSTWKLLRRDHKQKPKDVAEIMYKLLHGISGEQ